MCLAIPGKIVSEIDIDGIRLGRVEFGGVIRDTYLDFVPDAEVGDYVLVHVGVAISKLNEDEAERTLAVLEQLGAIEEELGEPPPELGENPQLPDPQPASPVH